MRIFFEYNFAKILIHCKHLDKIKRKNLQNNTLL